MPAGAVWVHDGGPWDTELAIVAGRIDLLLERVERASSIAARRFALDALARGLLLADPGSVTADHRARATAARVDPSTIAAASVPRLSHAVAIPLVARDRGVGFVRQVHVAFDPAGLMRDGALEARARRAAAAAITVAATLARPPNEPGAHALVAAQPAVFRAARLDGASLGAATLASAVALWSGRAVRPDRVVTGALAGDRVVAVGEMAAKVAAARAHGAAAIVVPRADALGAAAEASGLAVIPVESIEELLDATLEPAGARRDPERLAAEARELAHTGWDGFRWPSIREQIARISGTLPQARVDLRVEVLIRLAAAQRHSGDPVGCLELLGHAAELVRSDEGRLAVPDGPIVNLWIQTAMTQRQLCRFGAAARAARESVCVARRARLRGLLIKALGTLGLVALSRRRLAPAIAAFAESLELTNAHQPHDRARSRAYLIEAYGVAGRAADVDALLALTLEDVEDASRESWVRTSGATALLALGRPEAAARVLDAESVRSSLLEEPLPGLLARRRLGVALARSGEAARGLEVLAASPLVHGRALEPHLAFLAHVNVLCEARERRRLGVWDADIAGRARQALLYVPSHGDVPAFLGKALASTSRALSADGRPPALRPLDRLLERCDRLT